MTATRRRPCTALLATGILANDEATHPVAPATSRRVKEARRQGPRPRC